MSRLPEETYLPSLSAPRFSRLLNTGGQLHMAHERFGEDTRVGTTLNAWGSAGAEAGGQCSPWSAEGAADARTGLSRPLRIPAWRDESLGQNKLLPPGSSPCVPPLLGSPVYVVCTSWLLIMQIGYMAPIGRKTNYPGVTYWNDAKISRHALFGVRYGVFKLFYRLLISTENNFKSIWVPDNMRVKHPNTFKSVVPNLCWICITTLGETRYLKV